jgi:hypothetical protein
MGQRPGKVGDDDGEPTALITCRLHRPGLPRGPLPHQTTYSIRTFRQSTANSPPQENQRSSPLPPSGEHHAKADRFGERSPEGNLEYNLKVDHKTRSVGNIIN